MPHVAQPQEKGTNPLSNWAVGSPEDATAVHSSRCRIDWQRICGTLARLSGASAVCGRSRLPNGAGEAVTVHTAAVAEIMPDFHVAALAAA